MHRDGEQLNAQPGLQRSQLNGLTGEHSQWRVPPSVELENRTMRARLEAFFREEQGQDITEYVLLLAFVVLASAALFIGADRSMKAIWTMSSSTLSTASSAAS